RSCLAFRLLVSKGWRRNRVGPASVGRASQTSWPRQYLRRDPLRAREEGVLERRAVRDRRVGGRDPPGVVEVAERLLGHAREDLARPAPGQRALLDDGDAIRLP